MNTLSNLKSPKELLEYMNKNIKYGFVGKNHKKYYDMFSEEWNDWYEQFIVQSGEEVIKSKIGTCWDQVELERLWFDEKGYNIHTFFMWFEVDKENDFPTHTFLVYELNNKYYWFEHAFESEKGIHEFNSLDETIECVKSKQAEYTKMNNPDITDEDINCLIVYEYNKPENHVGVDDYLKYVTSNKYNSLKR